LNVNPILEFDRKGKLIYQNPAVRVISRTWPSLVSNTLLADWGKITEKITTGDLLKPLILQVNVGDLCYELACFAVAETG